MIGSAPRLAKQQQARVTSLTLADILPEFLTIILPASITPSRRAAAQGTLGRASGQNRPNFPASAPLHHVSALHVEFKSYQKTIQIICFRFSNMWRTMRRLASQNRFECVEALRCFCVVIHVSLAKHDKELLAAKDTMCSRKTLSKIPCSFASSACSAVSFWARWKDR